MLYIVTRVLILISLTHHFEGCMKFEKDRIENRRELIQTLRNLADILEEPYDNDPTYPDDNDLDPTYPDEGPWLKPIYDTGGLDHVNVDDNVDDDDIVWRKEPTLAPLYYQTERNLWS